MVEAVVRQEQAGGTEPYAFFMMDANMEAKPRVEPVAVGTFPSIAVDFFNHGEAASKQASGVQSGPWARALERKPRSSCCISSLGRLRVVACGHQHWAWAWGGPRIC